MMDTGKCGVYMTGFYSAFKKKGNPKVFKKTSEPGKLTVKSCTLDSERHSESYTFSHVYIQILAFVYMYPYIHTNINTICLYV